MSKMQRDKGANMERAVAHRFRRMGWPDAARNLTECRDANSGDLVHVKPFAVQIKCGAAPSPWRAMREARAAADPGDYPIAVVKRDREQPLVVMQMDDFCELTAKLKTFGIL